MAINRIIDATASRELQHRPDRPAKAPGLACETLIQQQLAHIEEQRISWSNTRDLPHFDQSLLFDYTVFGMVVSLSKRNLRVLSITALLLLLVFFVIQNANSISFGEEQASISTSGDKVGLTSAGTVVHNKEDHEVKSDKKKSTDEESTKVNAEIAKIKQEVKNGANSPEDDSISRKGAKGSDASGNGANAEFDPAKEYSMILAHSPVVIISKSYCPFSTRLKELLKQEYRFTPNYVTIELDKHDKGPALQKYIEKQTGRGTVPNLIINGKSRGGSDDIRALHSNGQLLANLNEWSDGAYKVEKIEKPSNN